MYYLPVGEFYLIDSMSKPLNEWIKIIQNKKEDDDYGYFFIVDLEYPEYLHDLHNDLPLAPEHYNHRLCKTLLDKKDYFIHYLNLQYYLEKRVNIIKNKYYYKL